MNAKEYNLRRVYLCRYKDLDTELCSFHANQISAKKAQVKYKKEYNIEAIIEMKKVGYSKKGFLDFFNKYGIIHKTKD